MRPTQNRRNFIKNMALSGAVVVMGGTRMFASQQALEGKRIGIIGLDTSHSTAFTKEFNSPTPDRKLKGYKVVAAYPYGSKTIESSASRIPGYTEEMRVMGVEITDSIEDLLTRVDVVLLETNDGRLHLEQALPVLRAKKRLFIDKPIAASLHDAKAIFAASIQHDVPVFSCSSLRYADPIAAIRSGELIGAVTGADTFSPAILEPSHPDLFWYGIHGVEMLYAIMGVGCIKVSRIHTESTDVVVGTWADGRIGTFRGTRTGRHSYGGLAYGENGQAAVGGYNGYTALLYEIVNFFESGIPPVTPEETLELFAFMEAADESKRQGGQPIKISDVLYSD